MAHDKVEAKAGTVHAGCAVKHDRARFGAKQVGEIGDPGQARSVRRVLQPPPRKGQVVPAKTGRRAAIG